VIFVFPSKISSSAWWYTPVIPATWKNEARGSKVQGQPGQLSETLSSNRKRKKKKKKAGHVSSVVESLPSMHRPWVDPQNQKKKKNFICFHAFLLGLIFFW
jgi:hypothetical protein